MGDLLLVALEAGLTGRHGRAMLTVTVGTATMTAVRVRARQLGMARATRAGGGGVRLAVAVLALGVRGTRRRGQTRLLGLVAIAALVPAGCGRLVDGVARFALVARGRELGGLSLMARGTRLG